MPRKPGFLPQVLMALWRYCDFHCQILNASFLSSSISFIAFLPVVVFWNRHIRTCRFFFVIEEFGIEHKYVYSALSNLVVFARSTIICERALLFEWPVNWAARERESECLPRLTSHDIPYCAFQKHANSEVQKPPSQVRFSLPSIIITITSNEPWNTEKHKTDRNPPISNHKPWPFELVEVNFFFLRGPLRWLTAAKNANFSWLLNLTSKFASVCLWKAQ